MLATIRPAQIEDATAIAELWKPIIRDTAITFTTVLKTPEDITQEIQTRAPAFLVAEDARGQLLGFATYSAFRGGPGYAHTKEHSIHLAPQARGQGLGRALLKAIETIAKAEGVHSFWAGISGENPAAQHFHAALGYQEMACLPEVGFKFGRYIDLVLMRKILT